MKSAADPYEFFRWKSSCGRLAVRTTWVKGVRHVVLSDDDDDDGPSEKVKRRQPRKDAADNGCKTPATNRPPLSEVDENHELSSSSSSSSASVWYSYNHSGGGDGGDESYVERVLQWLQKPSGMLETRRKPMSAPACNGARRPALVKTCSIPENKFADRHQQVVEADCKRPMTKSTRNCCARNHNQKTELHVHMPSVCPTANENGKDVNIE